jgi:hypothetical protein
MLIRSHLSAAALAALAVAPAFAAPAKDDPAPAAAPENPAACYVAVTPAANERKPRIERGPASPDSAAAWYAVDRREGGCRKLVKMGNPAVSLPEPPREEGVVMEMRAR